MSNRTALQSVDNAEKFITIRKIDSFESLAKFTEDSLSKYYELKERMQSLLQNGEKITLKQWKAEIQSLQAEYDSTARSRPRPPQN